MNKLHKDLKPNEFSPVILLRNNLINDKEYRAIMTWIWDKGIQPKRYQVLYKYTLNAIYKTNDILEAYKKYIKAPNLCKKKFRYKTIAKIIKYLKENK